MAREATVPAATSGQQPTAGATYQPTQWQQNLPPAPTGPDPWLQAFQSTNQPTLENPGYAIPPGYASLLQAARGQYAAQGPMQTSLGTYAGPPKGFNEGAYDPPMPPLPENQPQPPPAPTTQQQWHGQYNPYQSPMGYPMQYGGGMPQPYGMPYWGSPFYQMPMMMPMPAVQQGG